MIARALDPTAPRNWRTPPPIGQGLAVIVVLAAVALASLAGIAGYLVALGIGGQRTQVARLDDRIAAVRDEVAGLRREYVVRSRMNQLDRWGRQLDLQPAGLDQRARTPTLVSTARVREAVLAAHNDRAVIATPVAHGYPRVARTDLDRLVGAVLTD